MMTDRSAADNYAGVYEGRLQPGRRPALLIVDVVTAYLTQGSPLFMDSAAAALASNLRLANAARAAGVPVVFTNVQYKADGSDGGVFYRKAPVLKAFVEGSPLGTFPDGLTPLTGERVFTKQYPSAFFGTSLASTLTAMGVDSVMLTGLTTSGCVRASCVDAMSHGFRTSVIAEACGDRHAAPHEANLFDMNAKYADVVSEVEVVAFLASLKP